jgi:peptidoglycan/LPS O-acetylase OafA/YrhL
VDAGPVAPDARPAQAPTPPPRFAYQPALDGLRALAVIAVMVFHQRHLGGGFLGVDVFFVLSGFLITSLLLVDHAKTGKVVSLGFWRRRIRRLFPAILVLLVLVSIYAATVTKSSDLAAIRHGAVATLLYVQNYWLLHHPADFRSPINHTWSLSIEEQFYLVWPVLLAVLVHWTRRTRWLTSVIVALALGSAALMATRYLSTHTTGSSYGSTETRAQELLVGAALAVVLLRRKLSGRLLEAAGAIALAFLAFMVVNGGHLTPFLYKGGFLLVAIATAVLITAVVTDGNGLLRAALSWKPLVWIGLISYGLYLYHVPLFGFVDAQHLIESEPALVVMRFGLTLIVAIASYFVIERPIRRGALSGMRAVIVTPIVVACVVALVFATTSGATGPSPTVVQAAVFAKARTDTPTGTTRVLLAGDTLAASFVSLDQPDFLGSDIHGVVEWASGCDALGGTVAIGSNPAPPAACNFEDSYLSALVGYQPEVAVLTLGPSLVFDRLVDGRRVEVGTPEYREWLFGRLDALREALVRGHATFVLTTVPCMNPSSSGPYGGLAPLERDPRRIAAANDVLRDYAGDRNVRLADLGGFLCEHPGDLDGVRLTPAGATAAWQYLAPIARDARAIDQPESERSQT